MEPCGTAPRTCTSGPASAALLGVTDVIGSRQTIVLSPSPYVLMQIELGSNVIGYDTEGCSCCGSYRYVLLILGCLANIIAYSDRSNLSLAIVPMEDSLSLDEAQVGFALGAFFIGYIWTQILGGFLALHIGPKPVLLIAVATWSAATLITPPMATTSLGMLVFARIVIGLGEGLLLPCLHTLASSWVPLSERSTAAALMTSGQFLGTALALLCGPLAEWWWPSLFFLFGSAGIGWCLAFACLATSTPAESVFVSAGELAHITASSLGSDTRTDAGQSDAQSEGDKLNLAPRASASRSGGGDDLRPPLRGSLWRRHRSRRGAAWSCAAVPWRRLLTNKGCCAIFVAHATHNWGWCE